MEIEAIKRQKVVSYCLKSLFPKCDQSTIKKMICNAIPLRLSVGDVVIKENEPSTSLYFIYKGSI